MTKLENLSQPYLIACEMLLEQSLIDPEVDLLCDSNEQVLGVYGRRNSYLIYIRPEIVCFQVKHNDSNEQRVSIYDNERRPLAVVHQITNSIIQYEESQSPMEDTAARIAGGSP